MSAVSGALQQRNELAERQAYVAALLAETKTDQLLLLEPPNLAWFAGAPLARNVLDPAEQPALIISAHQRWLVSSNLDSQQLFDTYLDDLGFSLKEWPWHIGREQLLADLCDKKKICCDRLVRDAESVADRLRAQRLAHSLLGQDALRQLGRDVAHALEATGRAAEVGDSEGDLAGQVAHRLAHRGVDVVTLHAAADGRGDGDTRPAFTQAPCRHSCVLSVIGRRDGLHVAARRTIWFGDPGETVAKQFDAAGQVIAARVGALAPNITQAALFAAGQRVAEALHREHDWRDAPFGHLTGWLPIEATFSPTADQTLVSGQAVVLATRMASASYLDTFLISDTGADRLTRDEEGPTHRYRIGERIIELPHVLRR